MEPVQRHHSLVRELWRWWGCRLSPIRLPSSSHTHRHTHSSCNFDACLVSASSVSVTPLQSPRAPHRERGSGKQDEDRNTSTAVCILISAVMWCTFNPQGRESAWECSHWKKRYRSHVEWGLCLNSCKTLIYLTSPTLQQFVIVTVLNFWGL